MKSKQFSLIPILIICLVACSNKHQLVINDNTDIIGRTEETYNRYQTSNIRHLDKYPSLNRSETAHFTVMDRSNEPHFVDKEIKNFSLELPLKIDDSKKYTLIFRFDSFISADSLLTIFNNYATERFTAYFDNFLEETNFDTKLQDELDDGLSIYTNESTYKLYSNGRIGVEYSDGIYLSSSEVDYFEIYLEFLSVSVEEYYASGSINMLLVDGTDLDFDGVKDEYKLDYHQQEVTVGENKTLKEYFKDDDYVKGYSSYLFSSRDIDFDEMVKIKVGTVELYLDSDGQIFRRMNNFNSIGGIHGYLLEFDDNKNDNYYVYHSSLDTEELLKIFDK